MAEANNRGAPWTKVDIITVVDLTTEGATNENITLTLGRTVSAITSLKARRDVKLWLKGRAKTLPNVLSAKPGSTSKPARKGLTWSKSDDHMLLCKFAQGMALETIALELMRTSNGVLGRLKYHHLLEFDNTAMAYFIPRKLYQRV